MEMLLKLQRSTESLRERRKNMKKEVKFILGFCIIILAVFAYAHISKTHAIYDTSIDPSEYGSVVENQDVVLEQIFISEEQYLDGIKIKGAENGDISQVSICYTLKEKDTEKLVAEGEVNAKEALSTQFYELPFQRIENCKGKKYLLEVEQYTNDQKSSVNFMYEKKIEDGTDMSVNNEKVKGTVIMRTITKRFDLETFFVVLVFVIYIIFFIRILYKLFK